ncbi:hypothetical protein VT91_36610 [Clostridium sporogenes]|uniref:hypothetical protein n=1 Tax=Clostridium botulinum TaxID=1491 RepID=UPI00071764CA|nr:hypothetical protein [Clostridium botulinum]KRU24012.1 hypothetical protein VT91_35990 [Clostridium sporogenes]KRU24074.1 hypothetical protein VT91_36610 [Clostridium sporogenes]KRU28872.1 hypothetical protein WG71_17310 [Clostridium sporogenes]KRU35785.1 hypothetical protein VT28_00590 [Clostridium sporogenes]KRU47142.1 hypothetical protein VT95_08620 [Clostridium sporogenes]
MFKGIEEVRKQARKAIESLYDCTCNIYKYEKYKDPVTKETKTGINPVPKYENQLCKVSKQSLSKNNQTDTVNKVLYEIKLFIDPEVEIKQGDEIEVTNAFDVKTKYKAGEGFPYYTHQEVILNKEDKA